MLTKAFIPYKGYYSTPFSRWQGSMANENSIVLAGDTSKKWLAEKQTLTCNWLLINFPFLLMVEKYQVMDILFAQPVTIPINGMPGFRQRVLVRLLRGTWETVSCEPT